MLSEGSHICQAVRKGIKNVIALRNIFDGSIPVVNLVYGQEIDNKIVEGLVDAPNKGEKLYQKFVNELLVSGKKSFFSTIHRNCIDRGF